ncbi:MAG: hypothetical protein IKN96_03045, partial [Oscillibacter sp.]|nr:hypothetical protein [Oscillibacter sp.]
SNFTIDRTAAGATDTNAGLFRKLTNNSTVRNLRLEEFSVKAGTDGNAGGLVAVAEGNVTISTVLVRSAEKSVAANGSGAAGGLVGTARSAAGDSLTITNSAATMYVSAANGAAGGLIGTVAQGAATVDTSYAGGHTKDGKYADKNASAAWNVASASGAAGGLVGAVASGATLKTENSFSAASVNSETAEAGGVIGATDSANVTFSGSVYSAAPVSGAARLTEQSQDENSSLIVSAKSDAGALIGKSQDGVTFLHHTYYLPQLYNKAVYYSGKNSWNIYYKGAEENAVAEVIPDQMVSYGDENTPIAGTNANNLFLEQNTLTYDDAYNPEKKPDYPVKSPEYPFKVWTKFNFDGPEGPYYYGDFEVVQNTNSVDFNVKFKYKLGDAPVESLPADSEQTVPYTRDDGLSFIPAALPLQEGYEFCRWELTKENGKILQKDGADIWKSADGASQYKRVTLNHLIVEAADPNGTRSLTFTAVYKQNPVLRTIEYWYAPDPTSFDGYAPPTDEDKAPTYGPYPTALTNSAGKAVYAPLLSASVKLRGSDTSNTEYTKLKNVEPSDPSLTGYDFLGWYTATQEGDTKWPESAKVTFDDNPADALFTGKPENEPLKLYARFDRVRYYTVEVKFAYMEGSEEKPYDNANEKFRYKERTAPDAPNPNPVPLLDTPKEIEGIYRGTDKTTNYNTEAYVTTDSTTGKKTFNVNAALESDKTESYDPKAGDAETTYTVLYEADPIEESYYRVQYVLKRTTKAEATVARPEPDYIKYEHAKDAQGRLLYVTNDGVQLYKDGDNWYYESNGEQYAGAKPQGVRGAALEVTAPNDAQYSSNENDTYPAYCPYDRGFTEDELQHFTETRKSWAEAKKTIFSESELENFPEDMQGFHHLGATGVNYTWTNPDGTRRAGTQADPYIVTYTYDRNQYTLAFNTSGGTNFDAFTRYFGEPIDNGQTMKRTAVNYDLTEGNVTLKKDSAGKSYEEENIPQTLMNVAPYHEGQRLPTPTEEKEQAFWQWRASVYTDVDATWGKRTDLRRCDEDGNAVENLMPASDMLAKANYKPAKTTYTIVILKQSVDNSVHLNLLKSNDPETQKAINRKKTYEEVESVTVEADTDTPLTNSDGEYIGKGVRLNDTEYALTNNSSFNINFTGFEYRDTECLGEMKNGVPTVAADGSSVVKVYYDREVRNILLLTNNTTGYVQTDENPVSGRQYYGYIGEKDGSGSYSYSYVKLTPETVWTISETYEAGTGDNANYGVYNNNEVIQLYYRKSAWRTSDTNYGPVYNGTRYHKLNTPSSETEDTLYDLSDTPWSREGKTLGNSYWVKNSNASDASKIYKLTLTFATNPRWFCDDKDNSAYNGKEYTGARFKTSNSGWRVRHNLVGLYEQTFTQIGLSWPPEKANSNDLKGLWWYPQSNGGGTRTTFLNAFLEENKTVLTYYGIEDSGSAHIYHYTQPLAGNYPSSTSAATNTNEISGSTGWNTNTFYFSNKYTGFTVSQYRQDNGRWQTATIDASVSNFSNLYIRHERNTYKLTVKVTGIEWVSDKVDPEDFGFTQIPGTQTYKREIDVKYEESLKDKIDSIKNAGNIALTKALDDYNKSDHGGYQYTFWCTDTLCTENVENFNNKTMPAANMTLYAKLTPPTYYVKFELKSEESNYPADEVKPTYEAKNDAGQYVSTDPAPVEVQAGSNIDSQVAKDSGGLKDEYSPISHKYDLGDLQYSFDGWYYKVNGVEKKFYSSMPITPDLVADGTVNGKTEKVLTLYPKWAYIGKTYEPVRIRCYYKDEDGVTKHYLPFSYTVKTLKNVEGTNGMEVEEGPDVELRSDEYFTVTDEKGVVNATYHADPHNIKIMPDNPTEGAKYEYEPGTRIVRVEKNGENLIELEYVNTEWTYTVNYWVRLRNVVARNGESWIPEGGFNGDNEDIAVKVWSVSVPAMGECDEAFYNQGKHGLPEMFRKGYLLLGCHYENETGESKPVPDYSALVRRTVVEGKQNVLNFYMEPDPSKISISGGNDTYNGAQHEKTLSYDLDFTPIEGLEYQIVSQYWDLSSETELKDEQGNPKAPVDAGNYSETAYIQATYTPPPSEYIRYGRLDENGDPVKDADGNVIFEELKDENGNVIQIRREMTDANRAIITSPKEKYTYLVWKSENYDKRGEYFIVTPKTVTLTSASISVPYNGGVHKAEEVRVTEGGFAEGELSLTDGTVPTNFVTFAVDAFRRNPGTTKNVFDVDFSAYPAVKEENYAITKVYGTLTVTSGG